MKTFHKALAIAGMATMLLGACANSNPYPDNQAGNYGNSTRYSSAYGIVDSINAVQTDSNGSPIGIGTVIGGVVGGVLGNQVGGGTGRTVATAAGAVGGAVVGHEIEKNRNNANANAFRIGVRLDKGGFETITQRDIGDLRVGDRVRVENNHVTRY